MNTTQRLNALEGQPAALSRSAPCTTCEAPHKRSLHAPATELIGGACEDRGRLLDQDGMAFVTAPDALAVLIDWSPVGSHRLVHGDGDETRMMPEDVPCWLDAGHVVHITGGDEDRASERTQEAVS